MVGASDWRPAPFAVLLRRLLSILRRSWRFHHVTAIAKRAQIPTYIQVPHRWCGCLPASRRRRRGSKQTSEQDGRRWLVVVGAAAAADGRTGGSTAVGCGRASRREQWASGNFAPALSSRRPGRQVARRRKINTLSTTPPPPPRYGAGAGARPPNAPVRQPRPVHDRPAGANTAAPLRGGSTQLQLLLPASPRKRTQTRR